MSDTLREIEELAEASYEYGFSTDLDTDIAPPGLTEDTVRLISAKKDEPDWLLDWRLRAFEAWQSMDEPDWAKLEIKPIDYQALSYWAAPKSKPVLDSMDDVDPEIRDMFDKLGRLGIGGDDVQGDAGRGWCHLLFVLRSRAGPSRAGARAPGLGGAGARQLLRRAQLGRFL